LATAPVVTPAAIPPKPQNPDAMKKGINIIIFEFKII
jgi:hypothetical protein